MMNFSSRKNENVGFRFAQPNLRTQGGLRKAGISASQARKLRKQSEKFLRNISKQNGRKGCL